MKEEAQKTLGDLYAIRATMSLVAQNDDHSEEEKRAIRASDSTIGRLNDEMEKEKRDCKRRLDKYDLEVLLQNAGQNLQTAQENEEAERKTWTKEEEKRKTLFKNSRYSLKNYFSGGFWLFVIYFCILVGLVFVSVVICLFTDPGMMYVAYMLPVEVAIIVIVHTIIFLCQFGEEKKRYKSYLDNDYAKACEKLNKCTEAVKEAENQVAHYRAELEAGKKYTSNESTEVINRESQERVDGVLKQIEETQAERLPHTESVTALAAQSKALVDGAVKAYPVIDFRDWGNVDLLIYYFETGRADSVKEALQLVDRQRQTDQITQALEMASAEISRTIHQSMVQLGGALAQSFSVLSSQLAAQHNEMMQGMAEQAARQSAAIGAQTAAIERQSALQVSAQEMNTALLNKISTSSSRLATQMDRQLKEAYGVTVS